MHQALCSKCSLIWIAALVLATTACTPKNRLGSGADASGGEIAYEEVETVVSLPTPTPIPIQGEAPDDEYLSTTFAELYQDGDLEEMDFFFSAAVRLAPESPVALGAMAFVDCYYDRPEATQRAEKSLQLDPGNPLGLLAKAFLAEDNAERLSLMEQAHNARKDYTPTISALAIELKDQEQYERAVPYFSEHIKHYPESVWAHRNRAHCFFYLDQWTNAVKDYDWLLWKDPEDPIALSWRGASYVELGRYREASNDLRDSRALGYKNHWVNYYLIRAEMSLGDHDEAIRIVEQTLENDPDCVLCLLYAAQSFVGRGLHTENREDLERGIQLLEAYLEEYPEEPSVHMLYGAALLSLGRVLEAAARFNVAVQLAPQDSTYHEILAATYRALENYSEALASIERALALNPESLAGIHEKATILCFLGRPDEALQLIDKALETNPDHAPLLWVRGVANKALGNLEASEQDFARSIEIDPDQDTLLHENLARVRQELKNPVAEKTAPVEAVQTQPVAQADGDLFNRAKELLNEDEYAAALKEAKAKLKQAPEDLDGHLIVMSALISLREYSQLLDASETALRYYPNNERFLAARLTGLEEEERFQEALALANEALAIHPESNSLLSQKGVILIKMGRYEESIVPFSQILKRPEDEAIEQIALGWRAHALYQLGQYRECLRDANHLLRKSPDEPFVLSIGGNTLMKLGHWDIASKDFLKLIALEPDNANHHYDLARTYYRLGEEETAIQYAEISSSLDDAFIWLRALKARCLTQLGKAREALAIMQQVMTMEGATEDQYAYFVLGHVYSDLNQRDEAMANWRLACKYGDKNTCRWLEENDK